MKFGIFDHVDADKSGNLYQFYENRLKLVELYDDLGLYAYHIAEHHATPLGMAPSPNLFLSAVAQRTSKLRFGPLVYCLPLYHPLRLLEEICMLDQMSGGRLEMGIGRGISPIEVEYWGLSYEDGPSIYKESFELIKSGLVSDTLSYEGKIFKVDNMPLALKILQKPHPPLWYGIANPASTVWPAQNKLNIITNQTVNITRSITSRYIDAWQDAGHPTNELPLLGMTRYLVIARDPAVAIDLGRRAYPVWRNSFMALWEMHGKVPIGVSYPESFDELMANGQGIAGSPEQVLEEIMGQCEESGVNYFVARFAFGDLTYEESRESIELFSEFIIPQFAV